MGTKAKKVVAPKPVKATKPKKSGNVIDGLSEAKFVSLKVRAVIPTQQYGNIQPEIEVVAPTYELARDFVMPKIEELYKTYAERPINGNLPHFVGPVKETVKTVSAPAQAQSEAPATPQAHDNVPVQPTNASNTAEEAVNLSDAGLKAKKQIDITVTIEALNLVEQKIKDSVKIPENEKPVLFTMVIKKRKTF